jgi:hypothetical protein
VLIEELVDVLLLPYDKTNLTHCYPHFISSINLYMLRASLLPIMRRYHCIYRVIHKSLRDFRPLRYSSRDGHAEGSMSTEGETLQVSVLPYRCSIYAPLVTRQMSNFGKFHRPLTYSLSTPCLVTTVPLAVKPASTPRRLVQNKTWRDSLSIDKLLSAVSVLVVAQSSSEIPERLMNHPVYKHVPIVAYTQ